MKLFPINVTEKGVRWLGFFLGGTPFSFLKQIMIRYQTQEGFDFIGVTSYSYRVQFAAKEGRRDMTFFQET